MGGNAALNNLSINNNLYYPNANNPSMFYDIKYSYLSFLDWQNLTGYDQNSITADPLFVSSNPQVASDFKLQNNSPAIDAGIDVGFPYLGNAPDIGVYEYVESISETSVSTPTLSPFARIWNFFKSLLTRKTGNIITGNAVNDLENKEAKSLNKDSSFFMRIIKWFKNPLSST